jgi:hypothetical protein
MRTHKRLIEPEVKLDELLFREKKQWGKMGDGVVR